MEKKVKTVTKKPKKSSAPFTDPIEVWKDRASLLKVIAHPVRLMILDALSEEPRCVKDLNTLVDLVQAHLSQHMAALRKAKVIDSHANGALRCYYVCRPTLIRKLVRLLRGDHPYQEKERAVVLRQIKRNQELEGKTKEGN